MSQLEPHQSLNSDLQNKLQSFSTLTWNALFLLLEKELLDL